MSPTHRAPPRASRPIVAVAISSALACFAFPDSVAAQDAPHDLGPVEVYGNGVFPSTVDNIDQARRRLDQRAGGTGLVDGHAYRDGRVGTVTDALAQATGVFVQPRFGADEARLSIRGSGLQRTFHGRGIQLLQDGSPLNLADGSFDFQTVEPLATRYIEVYRGANALEFGAATLGGAINFVSPTGDDAAPLTLRLETGAHGYRRGQFAIAGDSGRGDGYLSLTGLRQDGFRAHAVQENYRLFGNAGFRFSPTLDGRTYLTHVDTRSQLPGNLTLAEAMRDPSLAAPDSLAQDQRRDYRLDRLAGKLAWAPDADRRLTLSLFHADKSLRHPIFQVLQQHSRDDGIDLRWQAASQPGAHRNQLTAGLSIARGSLDDARFVNEGGRAGAPSNHFDQHADNATLYVENQTWLDAHWVMVLGAQALRSSRTSRDLFISDGRDESFSADYSGISPKLGVRYIVDDHTQWFANISRSLEPPSFGELSGGAGVTPLDMQRARSGELGLRTHGEALSLDIALYRAEISGELLSLSDGLGNPLGTINAKNTLHQGVEFGVAWTFAPRWQVAANYLYNDFRFAGDPVHGDNTVAGVPAQQLRASLRWRRGDRLQVEPSADWVPQGYYIDHANTFRAAGYATFGLRLSGELFGRDTGAGWSWFADLRNLADRKWIASTNVVADAHGIDGRNFLPGDSRSLYVGVEWRASE